MNDLRAAVLADIEGRLSSPDIGGLHGTVKVLLAWMRNEAERHTIVYLPEGDEFCGRCGADYPCTAITSAAETLGVK